jgi:benzoate transport
MNSININSGQGRLVDDKPMKRGQIIVILLVLLLAVLDGYDLMSMAFVAPVVSVEWGIGKKALGALLASGLVGMAIGSLALAPVADRIGRRPTVLFALVLVNLATLGAGFSESMSQLLVCRVATGIGLGALIPLLATIASEYSNAHSRSFVVSCTSIGLPLGGAIGGAVGAVILKGHDWHWVFLTGAIAGAVMLLVAFVALPESPAFLVARQPKDALARLNKILSGWGHDTVSSLPPVQTARKNSYRVLFSPELRPETLRLIAVNVLMVIAGYYLLNWLPQIMTTEGFTPSTASMVSSTASMVGLFGPIILGALAMRFAPALMATIVMVGFGIGLIALGFIPSVLSLFILVVSVCAICMSGSAAMFQAIVVQSFPANVRASAIGVTMGVGRLASGLGPYLAGLMFAGGMTRESVSLCFAVLAITAGMLMGARRAKPLLASA